MNRHERRAKQSVFNKQIKQVLKSDDWGDWSLEHTSAFIAKFKNATAFWSNKIYSVQVYNDNGQLVAGIRRHDQSSDIPWSHKQRIKNEVFGEEKLFVECFPPKSELVDQANMFWIWEMVADDNVFNLKEAIQKKEI